MAAAMAACRWTRSRAGKTCERRLEELFGVIAGVFALDVS
jgi:hypothetical protein